eukprot:12420147-Alexandrium_andersonii.AAC.1
MSGARSLGPGPGSGSCPSDELSPRHGAYPTRGRRADPLESPKEQRQSARKSTASPTRSN